MPQYSPGSENKKEHSLVVWMPLLIGIALAVGLLGGAALSGDRTWISWENRNAEERLIGDEFEEILNFINYKYVNSLNIDSLGDETFKMVLKRLDPHSTYIPPDELAAYNEQSEGKYTGIGVEFALVNDTVRVVGLVGNDSPAESAGLKVGDAIIEVDGQAIKGEGIALDSLKSLLRGDVNDEMADLKIISYPNGSRKTMSLPRTEIKVSSIAASYILSPGIAYIKLDKFTATAYRDFMEALEKLFSNENSARHLVLDLRGNPGGYLEEAVKVASQFFKEKDRMIVFTDGDKTERKEYKTPGKVFFDIDNVVVLMDRNSASGAEVVAGAIQDWDRGIIIGETSYGKGLVQEQFRMSNGGAVRLTTARYFTPSGRLIQKPYDSNKWLGAFTQTDTLSLDTTTDQVFYTRIKKRKVYSGSGVDPDIPINRFEKIPPTYSSDVQQTVYGAFRNEHFSGGQIQQLDDILKDPSILDIDWESYMIGKLKDWYNAQNDDTKSDVLRQLSGELVRMTYGEQAKWEFLNSTDEHIEVSLKVIQADDPFSLSEIR